MTWNYYYYDVSAPLSLSLSLKCDLSSFLDLERNQGESYLYGGLMDFLKFLPCWNPRNGLKDYNLEVQV